MADLVKGDSNSKFLFTLYKRNGNLFDLTGHTVQVKWRIGETLHAAVAMTVLAPASDARVEYKLSAADLAEEGNMYVEVEVTETATAKKVSQGTISNLKVRGKVRD